MSLATKLKQEKKTAAPAVKAVTGEQHEKVVEMLRGRTMEMSFTVHGLPKNRRITGKTADQMAAAVGGKKKGIKASWSMFSSDHPAVKELNAAIRDLTILRDSWTIVRSADVQGTEDAVTIEGGKRLIWDQDVEEFHKLFVARARVIDKCAEKLQHAMNNPTPDGEGGMVPSIKDLDRENAGDAWDEAAYPKDLTLIVGVAKERHPDGSPRCDADGVPAYLIRFDEYHVSEKLPELLRERAIKRIDAGLSQTIETAMAYATRELNDQMLVFLSELTTRVKIFPKPTGKYAHLHDAEVVRKLTSDDDPKIPAGQVKIHVRYVENKGTAEEARVTKWFGPMPNNEFISLNPQATSEKKKIYPAVVESIVQQLQAFKEKKAKMLGPYGDNVVAAFDPLLKLLTKASADNPWMTPAAGAKKLVDTIKSDAEVKALVAAAVGDTVEALEAQVVAVKERHRRRTLKTSLVGKYEGD